MLAGFLRPRNLLPPLFDGAGRWYSKIGMLLTLPVRFVWRVLFYILRGSVFALAWGGRSLLFGIIWLIVALFNGLSRILELLFWPLTILLDRLGRAYPPALTAALRARWIVVPLAFAIFILAVAAIPLLGTNLVPDLSQGEFAFRIRLPEGTTLESNAEIIDRVESRALTDGRFERVFSVVGSWPSTASGRQTLGENLAQINFVLPEGATAEQESAAIERMRDVFALFPSLEAELAHPSVLSVRPPLAVHLFGEDLAELDGAAQKTSDMMWELPAVLDVATSSEPGNPEIMIELDRERAAELGVRAEPLSRSLNRQIGGEIVGQFREQEQRLDIRLRASEDWRDRASEISALRYRLDNGTVVPVSAFADISLARGPAAIHRIGGGRVAQVTAKVASRDLGRALEEMKLALAGLGLPESVVAEPAGQDEELKVSFDSLRLALLLAIFMVYVVMAVQFESLRHPFVILLAVPLGIVGVVLGLLVTNTSISVLALIGAVMLSGIVVNNAIVLVDAVNRRRRQGEALDEAILGAGRERLRPILMTTATTVLALLPMALGLGAGDELRRPLAITVIGGLTVATLLTLVVIPCLYRAMSGSREAAP
jgi:HAE1 family hydrophobic/amphiphilic exporter-1